MGNLPQLHSESNIGLIHPISIHSLIIGKSWKRKFQYDAQYLFKDMSHQPFHDSPNVMHGDKGHLDIDLGKFWLTIRSEVFIPKTPDDLIVSIKSGNHQN